MPRRRSVTVLPAHVNVTTARAATASVRTVSFHSLLIQISLLTVKQLR